MEMEAKGLLQRDWKRIRPTERGRRFLNDLLEAFLPDTRALAPASG
jgi:oxygen-independent coproporphyrinogen-3 oxidase